MFHAVRVKYGRPLLFLLGLVVLGLGCYVTLFVDVARGVVFLILGLFFTVLAALDWHELRADLKALSLTVLRRSTEDVAPSPRAPELEIVSVEERGGNDKAIDFTAEITNRGTRSCRASVKAEVDGWPALCAPTALDLGADDGVHRASVYVARPAMGDLIKAFDNKATLYGRTLTVRVEADGQVVERQWREHVYTNEENTERASTQRQTWRDGADLHPERLDEGVTRTRFCATCDDVTEQELTHLQRDGAGRTVMPRWHCRRHGGSPA